MDSHAEMLIRRRFNAVRFKQGAGRRAWGNGGPGPPSDSSGAFRYMPVPYPDREVGQPSHLSRVWSTGQIIGYRRGGGLR